jgi:hypothetical protein
MKVDLLAWDHYGEDGDHNGGVAPALGPTAPARRHGKPPPLDEYVRWLADPGWNRPSGGERGLDVARRSSTVLDEIERTLPLGNVLVVSHKATVRIMLCSLLGIDVGRYRDRLIYNYLSNATNWLYIYLNLLNLFTANGKRKTVSACRWPR